MTSNKFREFWTAGYRRLVPIVPPGAPVSELSTLAKRTELLGKIPGVRKDNGEWIGLDLRKCVATEPDLDRWHSWGAGVGIRTGDGLVALDIDTLDEALAEQCEELAREYLGDSPLRIGRWPKRLMVYRVSEPIPYRRLRFGGGLVELLSDDRQFVAHGVHPITGLPYTWEPTCAPLDELPIVTAQRVTSLFARLVDAMPASEGVEITSTGTAASVDQAQLLGEPEDVARAVAALPNTSALFPSYDDYVRVGYAIKGATQDDAAGLELFQQWAARWSDGDNDPDRVAADWQRMKPPFEVGAQYLFSLAQQHGSFSTGDAWFKAGTPATGSVWDAAPAEQPATLEPIKWANLDAWHTTEPPPPEWEVDGLIPRSTVTLLYGDGGVGKTLAIHQYAVCAAAGVPWLGQKTRPGRIMCVFCEDEAAELHRRHRAILKACNVAGDAVADRLRIVSRSGEDNILAAYSRNTGTMQRTAFWHQVNRDAMEWQADVVIIDTLADTFGGSEIDRGQVNQFVKYALGGLVRSTGGSAIGLGHPSVAGKKEGRSGSTAWSNAARSRLYLRRPDGKEKTNLRELEGMKTNRGALGHLLQIEWRAGAFALRAESRPIDPGSFEKVSVAGVVSLEAREEAAVLAALASAEREAQPLNLAPTSHSYAPKILLREYPDILDGVRVGQIEGVIIRLQRAGRIKAEAVGGGHGRHRVSGFSIIPDKASVFS